MSHAAPEPVPCRPAKRKAVRTDDIRAASALAYACEEDPGLNAWVAENPGSALAVARYVAGERPHHEPRELVSYLQVRLDVVRMLGAERGLSALRGVL
jgi:hypothetical protein